MLHTKFYGNRPAGSGEKIFEGFLPYMGMVAILVVWPASCHQIFISLYLKTFIQNLVQIGTVVSPIVDIIERTLRIQLFVVSIIFSVLRDSTQLTPYVNPLLFDTGVLIC